MVLQKKNSNELELEFESPSIVMAKMANVNLEEFEEESMTSGKDLAETAVHGNDKAMPNLAHDEDRAVWHLKWVVVTLLVCVALAICLFVFFLIENGETESFQQDFEVMADKMVDRIGRNFLQRIGILEDFCLQYTHQGQTQVYPSWPFVMLPGRSFHYQAEKAALLSDTMSLGLMHIVTTDQKEEWKHYVEENRDWLPEAQAAMNGISLDQARNESVTIPSAIINMDKKPPYMVTNETGPYAVFWQGYPAHNDHVYSVNLLSHPHYHDNIELVVAEGRPALLSSYDFMDPEAAAKDPRKKLHDANLKVYEKHGGLPYQNDPVGPSLLPVFKDFDQKEVVGVMIFGVYWRTLLSRLLPTGTNGVVVVLENTAGQQYTYRIDGTDATFEGHGDFHDTRYDRLEAVGYIRSDKIGDAAAAFQARVEDSENSHLDTNYRVRVYPSQLFESAYRTERAWLFALSLAMVFVFTSSVFLMYDYCVERRQRIVAQSAEKSGAIVHSLFPEQVREHLYEDNRAKKKQIGDGFEAISSDPVTPAANAHLYPECTVFFCDIAGFTKWSSCRTPVEVFELLEALYAAFDANAKRRKVFKIETIGDCYVATTGLPKAQLGHALIMARFANDCMKRALELVHEDGELCQKLGKDTSELAVRVGMHSGPVTAGVLRGDKQRFQIFGDTVNTASRMESNGVPNGIHVSESTAQLLKLGGKEHWLTPREDKITAKGKGEMQTYWVVVSSGGSTGPASTVGSSELRVNQSFQSVDSCLSQGKETFGCADPSTSVTKETPGDDWV
ncbi:Receptor-type guanylate cyclase gcy [Seminavis robusta]|uniref:Receptor-type guanylate cyclase gcy n=1 Tax=Seminavis robusta TaxID=568900 RepID=A0A9N8D709_9STRA|nr:Receptor-type guanylate cyclase gcy [Seminavis robusta]|eukprot:Sro21_g014590.1 Receptor-type guanylate cyclase gcy (787) ;mRNA; r:49741-52950